MIGLTKIGFANSSQTQAITYGLKDISIASHLLLIKYSGPHDMNEG